MKFILSHPTGNQNVRAVAQSLYLSQSLIHFYTTLAVFDGSMLDKLSRYRSLSELGKRKYSTDLRSITKTYPLRELIRIASQKAKLSAIYKPEVGIASIDQVYQALDLQVSKHLAAAIKNGLSHVYAYEDGAYHSFRKAKELGIKCIYDLPIGYWRAAHSILRPEAERRPEWATTLTGLEDSFEKLTRKDQELQLADQVFVASNFTAQTLKDYHPGKLPPIRIVPYGFPTPNFERTYSNFSNRKLKLLFVGGLSQRKGIADLFEAVNGLSSFVELTIVGQRKTDNCPALDRELKKHRWIQGLNHSDILSLMATSDILIFPSLFEGFGLVITEAMSQGTPVITTDRTIGPNFIETGRNGWIIPPSNPSSITTTLDKILSQPSIIRDSGEEARKAAAARPWSQYIEEMRIALQNT